MYVEVPQCRGLFTDMPPSLHDHGTVSAITDDTPDGSNDVGGTAAAAFPVKVTAVPTIASPVVSLGPSATYVETRMG